MTSIVTTPTKLGLDRKALYFNTPYDVISAETDDCPHEYRLMTDPKSEESSFIWILANGSPEKCVIIKVRRASNEAFKNIMPKLAISYNYHPGKDFVVEDDSYDIAGRNYRSMIRDALGQHLTIIGAFYRRVLNNFGLSHDNIVSDFSLMENILMNDSSKSVQDCYREILLPLERRIEFLDPKIRIMLHSYDRIGVYSGVIDNHLERAKDDIYKLKKLATDTDICEITESVLSDRPRDSSAMTSLDQVITILTQGDNYSIFERLPSTKKRKLATDLYGIQKATEDSILTRDYQRFVYRNLQDY